MVALVWNQPESKRYEFGVDRGVFYPQGRRGVPWNGLVSVEESSIGGESNSYYFDGIKYHEKASPRNFQATVTAFTAPTEFSTAVGERSIVPGFVLTRQARSRFGFSYRTLLGENRAYKIHLVYNALAVPNKRDYRTLEDSPSPSILSWTIDATPPKSTIYQPSAHYVVDSTKVNSDALSNLESILYGYPTKDARLPTVEELIDLIGYWDPYIIIPNTATGLADLSPGAGDLTKTSVPGIFRSLSSTQLIETANVGLYRLE